MKRVLKFFLVAISVSIIFSALAFNSLAADDGVTYITGQDFEGATEGSFASNRYSFIIVGRSGNYEVRTSDNGNKYALQLPGENTGVTDTREPYIWLNIGSPQMVNGVLEKAKHPISNYKYYALDFDYMAPTGKHTDKTYMQANFASYYVNEQGKRAYAYFSSMGADVSMKCGKREGEMVLSIGGVTASFKCVPGEWKHITYIVEPDTTVNVTGDNTVTSYNLTNTKIHVYVDGERLITKDKALAENPILDRLDTYYDGTLDYTALVDFRLNFYRDSLSDKTARDASAYDNMKVTGYQNSYTGDVDDVAAYYYNENYEKPGVTSVAKVDGVGYGWIVEAAEAARTGSLFELYCDLEGVYKPETPQKVITNGHSFTYDEGNWLIAEPDGEGNIVFREPTEDEQNTVRWLAPDGSVLKSEKVVDGRRATPPAPYAIDGGGWYAAEYKWGFADGSLAIDESYTISSDVDFHSVLSDIRVTASGARYTARITGGFEMILAIPKGELPEEITAFGVYKGSEKQSACKELDKYDLYSAGVADIRSLSDASADLTVRLSVKLPSGDTKEISGLMALKPTEYLRAILEDGEYIGLHGAAAALTEYINQLVTLSGGEVGDGLRHLMHNYSAVYSAAKLSGAESLGSLSETISSVDLTVGQSSPVFRVSFKEGTRVKKISFNIAKASGEDKLFYSYGADEATVKTDADGYITELCSVAIPLYCLNGAVSIELTTEDGKISGSYGINNFYSTVKSGATAPDGGKYTASTAEGYKRLTAALYTAAEGLSAFFYEKEPIIPSKAREFVITYEDYDAAGDGVTDDYAAIKAAHDFANSLAADGYINVVVRADEDATYYIGAHNGYASGEQIVIKTNTDWRGATFIIDDGELSDGSRHLFEISGTQPPRSYNSASKGEAGEAIAAVNKQGLKAGADTVIDLGLGHPALLSMTLGIGAERAYLEVIVDGEGRLSPETPIDRDYTMIYDLTVRRLDDVRITVEDGSFVTVGAPEGADKPYRRGILISRSGVTVSEVSRSFAPTEEDEATAEYSDFIEIKNALNTSIIK